MKKYIALIIGVLFIVSLIHYFPRETNGTQSIYTLPTSRLNNIEQTKCLYYKGEHVGVINYSKDKLEVLLFYDTSRVITSKHDLRAKRAMPFFKDIIVDDIKSFAEKHGECYTVNCFFTDGGVICNTPGWFYAKSKYSRVYMDLLINEYQYPIHWFDTCSFSLPSFIHNDNEVYTLSLKVTLVYSRTINPYNWQEVASKEFPLEIIVEEYREVTLVVDHITPTIVTFRSNIENFLQNNIIELYDKNSFTKLDKPITQDSTYTFTISGLTPNTEYRIVYGDKEMFVTTLEEPETLDLIPLGTEKTPNSFVQVYKVIGEDVNHQIQLKYENNVWNYDPQFDGDNYYVVFDELVTGDYEYTITISNIAGEKRYSNSFYIKNIEEDLGISLDVDPAKIGEDSFYLRFKVKGEGYYDTYFEYMNEQTFKVEEVSINHGIRYDDVSIENLTEGDYSYKLIVLTEKGNIEHEGSFTIKKEVQPTYVPPYTPPSENESVLPYLAVIIVILVIGYIFIRPKVIKTKKRRR